MAPSFKPASMASFARSPAPRTEWTIAEAALFAARKEYELLRLLSADKKALATARRPGAGGERSRAVHAYRVNTLAGEVFTRVNTSSWQVFTHLPLNPKKSLCGTRLAVWRTRSVPTDSRQSSNSRSDNSSVSASYSSVEDLCAYLNTSGMLRRMWFFRWKACRPYHTICGWTDNSQAKAGRGVDTIMLRHLHCRRHQFICKPSQV